ncbi:MAG: hypothetical protein ACP5N1_03200 [Candidatus Woesearchaeota archaeon]
MHNNSDEIKVLDVICSIDGINARFADLNEDCGHQKADIVIEYDFQKYYLQVSKQPKSQRVVKNLKSRGTYAINTYKYHNMPLSNEELCLKIKSIINYK